MFDLDKIKNNWQQNMQHQIDVEQKDEAALKFVLQQKSNNSIQKIKRNIYIEFVVFCVSILVLIAFAIVLNNYKLTIILGVFFIVIYFPYLLFYKKMYSTIISLENIKNDTLKNNISNYIIKMKYYLNLYVKVNTLLTPLVYISIIVIFLYALSLKKIIVYLDFFNKNNLIFIGSLVVFISVITIPIMNFYIKKMYKNHLSILENNLKELE